MKHLRKITSLFMTLIFSFLISFSVMASDNIIDIPKDEKSKGAVAIEGIESHEVFIPDEVTPFTRGLSYVDGGTWKYGTYNSQWNLKTVYSEYKHPQKQSHTTATIDGRTNRSGWKTKNNWACSSADGRLNYTGYAYYDIR